MTNEQILSNLIMCYQNDIESGLLGEVERNEITREEYHDICKMFADLIIEFTRFIHDIRYCSKKDCSCSPEKSVKALIDKLESYVNNPYYLYPMRKKWVLDAIAW